MTGYKKGSMREVVAGIYTIFRTDEELMRALVYPPEDDERGHDHPVTRCPNIVPTDEKTGVCSNNSYKFNCADELTIEEYWELVDKHIMMADKVDKIENEALCRLYIYPGRRRAIYSNYLLAKQEVIVDVLVEESFNSNSDMRIEWINDRLNEVLSLERVQGALGKIDYAQGNPRQAPTGYSRYQHVFVFGTGKK